MKSSLFCLRSSGLLAVLLGAVLQFSAVAADEPATTGGAAESGTKLEGRVEIGVTLNELRDARLSISRVRKAIANLFDEVCRRQVMLTSTPNVVGTVVINTRTPVMTEGPVLPARKKWVDASIAEIGPIIKLFKEDVDVAIEDNRRTDVSPAGRESLDPLREEAFSLIKSAFDKYQKLESLTANGPPYDNNAISSTSEALDKDIIKLDKTLKRGMSILNKEAKLARKNKKNSKNS